MARKATSARLFHIMERCAGLGGGIVPQRNVRWPGAEKKLNCWEESLSTTAAGEETLTIDTISEVVDARPGSRWMRPVEIIAALLLVGVIGLLLTGVFSRYVLQLPIVWIDEAASICFLWLAMLGAAIAIDRNEHMRLSSAVVRAVDHEFSHAGLNVVHQQQ